MFTESAITANTQLVAAALPVLYCEGDPVLNSAGQNVAAIQVTINAQNLFSFVGDPSAAATTTIYKSWLDAPPDVSKSWSILLASGDVKPVQFVRYENRGGIFVTYFKHSN